MICLKKMRRQVLLRNYVKEIASILFLFLSNPFLSPLPRVLGDCATFFLLVVKDGRKNVIFFPRSDTHGHVFTCIYIRKQTLWDTLRGYNTNRRCLPQFCYMYYKSHKSQRANFRETRGCGGVCF